MYKTASCTQVLSKFRRKGATLADLKTRIEGYRRSRVRAGGEHGLLGGAISVKSQLTWVSKPSMHFMNALVSRVQSSSVIFASIWQSKHVHKEPCPQSFSSDGHVTLESLHQCCLYRCDACILLLTCKGGFAQMVDGQDVKGMDLPALVERIPHENRRCILYRLVDKPGAASGQHKVCCLSNTHSLISLVMH